jgi:hypothetical protein
VIQASDRIGEALRAVMEREGIPEEAQPASFFQRLLSWMPAIGGAAEPVLLVVAFLGVVLLLFAAVAVLRRLPLRRRSSAKAGEVEREHRRRDRARELRARARAAEQRGDLLFALRLGFMALLVELDETGEIEFRPTWTDRELLLRGSREARVAAPLAGLIDDLEPKFFGERPITAGDLRRVEDLSLQLGARPA